MQVQLLRSAQTPVRRLLRLLAMLSVVSAGWAPLWADDLSGVYQGKASASDASRRVFTLELAQDGTAVFDTLYLGKGSAVERGRWTQEGTEVILTFDAMGPNRPPRPISFRHRDHLLRPIHWDPSEWGREGPPVFHRSESRKVSAESQPGTSSLRMSAVTDELQRMRRGTNEGATNLGISAEQPAAKAA